MWLMSTYIVEYNTLFHLLLRMRLLWEENIVRINCCKKNLAAFGTVFFTTISFLTNCNIYFLWLPLIFFLKFLFFIKDKISLFKGWQQSLIVLSTTFAHGLDIFWSHCNKLQDFCSIKHVFRQIFLFQKITI